MSDRRDAILNADLRHVRVGNRTISLHAQRSLLIAIAACEGEPVTTWHLKATSKLGERYVRLATQALEQAGLITVTPGKPNTYHIRWERLAPKAVPA